MKIKMSKIKQLLSYIKHINYISFKYGLTIGSKEYDCFEYLNIMNGKLSYCLIEYNESNTE